MSSLTIFLKMIPSNLAGILFTSPTVEFRPSENKRNSRKQMKKVCRLHGYLMDLEQISS